MMSIMHKLGSLLFLLVVFAATVNGQDQGELEDVEIEIVRERLITLPPANRNFEKIPPRPAEPVSTSVEYTFRPLQVETTQINPVIKPLRLKQADGTDIKNGYISLGYGNYGSPYVEGAVNSGKDKNKLVGAHGLFSASNKGPVDGKNSGSGMTLLSLYGRSFSQSVSFSGDINYENRTTHFYGYPSTITPEARDIRQSYNVFDIQGSISNAKASDFSYNLGGMFSYLADRFNAKETEVQFTFKSNYKISDVTGFGIGASYNLLNRKDSLIEATPRHLFTATPKFQFTILDDLRLTAGLKGAYENDSIDAKNFHVYPDIHASYPLSPSVEAVASLTGGIEKVSLHTVSDENIWIQANIPLFHTNKLYDLQASLRTRIGNKVSVNGGFSFAGLKNWYFYLNDPADQSKFVLDYEDKATLRTNFFASLGYAHAEKVNFLLRGDVYDYNRDTDEAWHRPTFKVTSDLSFNLVEKILFDISLIAQGGMKAKDPVSNNVMTLDPAVDLNARTEYLVSDKISIFVQLNNILSSEYPLYLYYPARGFQGTGGFTWNF